jgi:hypothetical protein
VATCPFLTGAFLLPTCQSLFDQALVGGPVALVRFIQHHCCMPHSHSSLGWRSHFIVAISPLGLQTHFIVAISPLGIQTY